MKNPMYFLLSFILFFYSQACADNQFGYVSYSTTNIGDDIQALAAKRFLPKDAIAIDREYISNFTHSSTIKTVINGWFMHTKSSWIREGTSPEKSWPPSSALDPLFISIHLTGSFLPIALSAEGIEYFKQHGPIGARDLFTLEELEKRDIPCYFSGCLTLTFENSFRERNNIIYVVDLDDEIVDYIKSKTKSKVIVLTHGIFLANLDNQSRLKYAEQILNKYRKAKCVITSRLHACMPCLAFETPVLLIAGSVDRGNHRFHGLGELARNCSKDQLLNGEVDYDFDHPPENPRDYIPIRENLIKIMENWVETNSK